MSRGLPKLREAVAALYERKWGVELDPELEITNTIGSKEGFSHLMWVLLDRGDAAIVPSPSYPIHIYGPLFAGADLRQVPMRSLADPRVQSDFAGDFFDSLTTAYDVGWPKPRVLVISFPHNPTGAVRRPAFMQRVVDFCREREMIVVHDFAYADIGFDGYEPPSHPAGRRRQGVRRRAVLDDQELLDGRLALRVPGRQRRGRAGAGQAEELPRLRHVPAGPDRRHGDDERGRRLSRRRSARIYQSRRDALIDGLGRIGWDIPKPKGSMFVWAPIPEPYAEMDSVEFCSHVVRECDVALSPGVGFGPGGEGFVRFALIENEQRIAQGIRNLKRGLHQARLMPARLARIRPHGRHDGDARRRRRSDLGIRRIAVSTVSSCGSGSRIGRARSARWPAGIGAVARRRRRHRDPRARRRAGDRRAGRQRCPTTGLIDLLVAEIGQVDGVAVEDVRPIDRGPRPTPAIGRAGRWRRAWSTAAAERAPRARSATSSCSCVDGRLGGRRCGSMTVTAA